ncbi:hypothetical protein CBL_05195 [Carabus blaptoides fortunei]
MEVPLYELNILTTSMGMVYGPLKLVIDNDEIDCGIGKKEKYEVTQETYAEFTVNGEKPEILSGKNNPLCGKGEPLENKNQNLNFGQPSHPRCLLLTQLDSLVREVGVSRVIELTPRAKKLHRRAKILKKKLDGVQRRKNSYKDRMNRLENMSDEEMLNVATTSLNKTAADFIKSQISLSRVKTKGRRYALDSKYCPYHPEMRYLGKYLCRLG